MRLVTRAGRDEDWVAMRAIFTQAGQAAWGHILPAAVLADLAPSDRWQPRAGADVLVAEDAGQSSDSSACAPPPMKTPTRRYKLAFRKEFHLVEGTRAAESNSQKAE